MKTYVYYKSSGKTILIIIVIKGTANSKAKGNSQSRMTIIKTGTMLKGDIDLKKGKRAIGKREKKNRIE